MDRLAAIKVFVAIAEAGSLSAAGRRLGMPLSTVSRQLTALENDLGARLITRTTRDLTLTQPGRHYLDSCRRVIAELEVAERQVVGERGEPQGELAVTAPAVFGRLHVLPIITEFLKAFPRITMRLLLVDRVVELIEEGLDISVRIGPLPDSSLIATRVGTIRHVTCASPAYLTERGVPALPRELVDHDVISFTALGAPDRWIYPGGRMLQRISVRPRLIVNTAEVALDAARAGLGITRVLSYQAAKNLADRSLRLILEAFEPEEIPVSLLHREDRLPQAKVQSFIAFAVPRLRKTLTAQ
jgi:DNA-binding transcriptional LysR family regulator